MCSIYLPILRNSTTKEERLMITCKDCGAVISPHDRAYSGLCGECLMRHKQGASPHTHRKQSQRKEERLQLEALTRLEIIINRIKRIKEYKNEPRISDIINEPDILALDKILDILKDKLR